MLAEIRLIEKILYRKRWRFFSNIEVGTEMILKITGLREGNK